ncbi:hypothetical protein [Alteromonas macleodii]|uniref:Uncharacterized protein n=1 Tax=Alteromonas macleodii TaxID=28108 RepID=A0AB36FN81_ALTMA|nr:hypothetical protein [Alteromonas macleodii]OES24227.1 hypothetical protein BFV93_4827 [Alteromonas macleodii]OES24858.1 hypothetical protein BFV95_4617 [Alteromonas macleodii]OES25136.1 hypothetical protein BFV94_4607 [Alteromonas macleodii]OES39178.1 hypothetical protein BFV96_4326 [Alteromonas macleodii]
MEAFTQFLVSIGFHQWGIFFGFFCVGVVMAIVKKKQLENSDEPVTEGTQTQWPTDSTLYKLNIGKAHTVRGHLTGYRNK